MNDERHKLMKRLNLIFCHRQKKKSIHSKKTKKKKKKDDNCLRFVYYLFSFN